MPVTVTLMLFLFNVIDNGLFSLAINVISNGNFLGLYLPRLSFSFLEMVFKTVSFVLRFTLLSIYIIVFSGEELINLYLSLYILLTIKPLSDGKNLIPSS